MISTIRISEPTLEQAQLRLAELVKLYQAIPMDRILFKGGRYVVTVEIV